MVFKTTVSKERQKIFTPDFKRESALLVIEQGYSIQDACRAMDVGETAMRKWVKILTQEISGKTPDSPALTPAHKRIQELEQQVKRLEMEKAILKKATALLMADEIKHTY